LRFALARRLAAIDAEEQAMRNPATWNDSRTSDDGAALAGLAAGGLAAVLFVMEIAVEELALLLQFPLGVFLR
jgi:hypothetical protein